MVLRPMRTGEMDGHGFRDDDRILVLIKCDYDCTILLDGCIYGV